MIRSSTESPFAWCRNGRRGCSCSPAGEKTLGALPWLFAFAFAISQALTAAPQHGHGASEGISTFLVEGLRVDAGSPPPGSGVGRAGAVLPGGSGYLHVVHGKPYVRGRSVFGGLVAWDQVWATGAHQSSELATTVPLLVGETRVEPGVYSLFTTPGRETWTLHLNAQLGMHLADEYDPELDAATVTAEPQRSEEVTEGLVLEFVPRPGGVFLRLRWDRTIVDFPLTTPTY